MQDDEDRLSLESDKSFASNDPVINDAIKMRELDIATEEMMEKRTSKDHRLLSYAN